MKNNMNFFYFLLITFLFLSKVFAQKSSGGVPAVLKNNLSINNIPVLPLQTLNNEEELQRADSISYSVCSSCKNNYYGRGIDVSIDIKNDGQLTILNEDSSKLWTLALESSTAYGVQFFFSNFNIPVGAELFFYSADSNIIMGAYTSDNNPINIVGIYQFATQYIKGKKIIIEYKEPNNADFEGELKISTIVHIFRDIFDKSGPFTGGVGAGSCNINAVCPLGSGWENEIKSVGIILYYNSNNNLEGFCSGAVINNTKQDGRPLFLTANHCVDDGSGGIEDFSTWLVLFNHQTTTCESDGSDVSSYTGQSVPISSILSRAATPSDYCLMELQTQVETLQQWGVCYAGWDSKESGGSSSSSTVGIHHPSGDVKKISKDFDSPCSAGYLQNCGNGDNHWRVQWNNSSSDNNGVTEGGSSGSPLFNSNHRIIGQLHGGYSGCPDSPIPGNPQDEDYYGKFSLSWSNSGANGFAFYLDPDNTGMTAANTYCPAGSGPGGSDGSGTNTTFYCTPGIQSGMTVNGNFIDSDIPCIDMPIILSPHPDPACLNPNGTGWYLLYTIRKQKCNEVDNSSLCKHTIDFKCKCMYLEYFIEISEVDINFNTVGNVHSKWLSKQIDIDDPVWTVLHSITVDQNDLTELGVSLEVNKLYRIKFAANQNGWKEAVRYFRLNPKDIYLANKNLMNTYDFWANFPTTFLNGSVPASELLGRNVTLDHITTNNDYGTNNIHIMATKSISITNSELKPGFIASIVTDDCENYSGRMANPNGDNGKSKTNKNINDRLIYYNSTPISKNNVQDTKNNNKENLEQESNVVPAILLIPNPSSNGKFTFSANFSESKNYNLTIYNLLGERIFQSRIRNNQLVIDISNQTKGVYFAEISNGEELSVQKIVYQ